MELFGPVMLIIYAIVIMIFLLDIKITELSLNKQIMALVYVIVLLICNIIALLYLGAILYGQFLPILLQIPIYIGFFIVSKYKGIKLLFVGLSAIVLSNPPMIFFHASRLFLGIKVPEVLLVLFFSFTFMTFIVYKLLKSDFNYMLKHCQSRQFWLFCLIPLFHFFFTYLRTSYNYTNSFTQDNFLLYQIPTIIVFVSYVLLVRVFRNARETQLLQNDAGMMKMHIETAQLRLEELKNAQEQTIIYRHDMRHHLSLLHSYVSEGDISKIKLYLNQAQKHIEEITPIKFSQNETVNLILSSFVIKAKQLGIDIVAKVSLPNDLPMKDTEVCALLSNLLENSVTAVQNINDGRAKRIQVNFEIYEEKLLLEIRNPYIGSILFEDGLPKNSEAGHGYGTKSIAAIVSRYHGMYSFKEESGEFIVRIVI